MEKAGMAETCNTSMPCNGLGLCPEDPCNSDDQIYILERSLFLKITAEWGMDFRSVRLEKEKPSKCPFQG